MTSRFAIAADPSDAPRPSARVATVAGILDCDDGDVRRLIRNGELETHGKGIRGVRVFLDSVRAYQDRQAKPLRPRAPALVHRAKMPAPASTASFRAAMAGLKAKGLA